RNAGRADTGHRSALGVDGVERVERRRRPVRITDGVQRTVGTELESHDHLALDRGPEDVGLACLWINPRELLWTGFAHALTTHAVQVTLRGTSQRATAVREWPEFADRHLVAVANTDGKQLSTAGSVERIVAPRSTTGRYCAH